MPCMFNSFNSASFSPMETASAHAPPNFFPTSTYPSRRNSTIKLHKPSQLIFNPIFINHKGKNISKTKHLTSRISAVSDVSIVSSDPAQVEITWEIVVGALAGVTPFVVAGIEFSKRIVKQRKCQVCGGSGLVLRDKKYFFRCPSCGGFLPWQSWRRFFTG